MSSCNTGIDLVTFFPTRYRMSPLMYAAREGRVKVCEKLLEHGAEVNKQDMRGWTVSCLPQSCN